MNQLCRVETVDGFGQGVVVAFALATDGRLDAGFSQTLGGADGNVLRSAIRMKDQTGIPLGLASIERLLQGIQNKVGAPSIPGAIQRAHHDKPQVRIFLIIEMVSQ